ncbi:DNA invertase Pin-like site-specific DNA recombinase [Caballeronia udeis]|uniref:DNA invertase Pin-like site-specific DNA recombinase n=1 Tax=Caballeronia udeis TaxID=1232866 RepID=A0ABW8MLT3_9BURK
MDKQKVIERIIELRSKGVSIAAVCTRLGISRATYYRYVANTAEG